MGRRDFLTLWLQALLLSLFPWLRTEEGIAVAGRVADAMVPQIITDRAIFKGGTYNMSVFIKGFEMPGPWLPKMKEILAEQGEPGFEVKA